MTQTNNNVKCPQARETGFPTLTLGIVVRQGSGRSKQEAKRHAAESCWGTLLYREHLLSSEFEQLVTSFCRILLRKGEMPSTRRTSPCAPRY